MRAAAELVGTAFLLVAVVGSGIMAERLAGGNVAIALLANSLATGAALIALILAFGPVSGAHLNPIVSALEAARGRIPVREAAAFAAAQIVGALVGVAIADVMFGLDAFTASTHARTGVGLWLGEVVATFGLYFVIAAVAKTRAEAVPLAVGAYITGAYWFTSSTSFANPAVTIARMCTDTFAGIRPADAPAFIGAQCVGAALAYGAVRVFVERRSS